MAKKSGNRNTRGKGRRKTRLIGLAALLLLLGGSLAFAGYFIFLRSTDPPLTISKTKAVGPPPPQSQIRASRSPAAANPDITTSPPPTSVPLGQNAPQTGELVSSSPPAIANPLPKPHNSGKPKVAIVVDDMGLRDKPGTDFLSLDLPLSFSFLPFSPFGAKHQKEAHVLGRDILLHLPLEPTDHKWDPGPGALLITMDPATRERRFEEDLHEVPHAIGINNHMGSRFTADRTAMTQLLSMVKKQHLFFLDSLTSSTSIGHQLASTMGIAAAQRTVFLDNIQTPEAITGQIELLIQRAREQGEAIAICHPHPATLAALRGQRTRLLAETEMVGVSNLVH